MKVFGTGMRYSNTQEQYQEAWLALALIRQAEKCLPITVTAEQRLRDISGDT